MLPNSKFYHFTGITYNKADQLSSFIDNEATWDWQPNFHVCQNFKEELFKDDFLGAVGRKFGGFLSLYKVPARCFYKWHRDGRHMWSINMVLDNFNSHTLFEKNTENTLMYIDELVYNPKEWVIFNTQELHSVVNLDHRDRVLVTYRISQNNPNKRSYQEVLDWFINEYRSN